MAYLNYKAQDFALILRKYYTDTHRGADEWTNHHRCWTPSPLMSCVANLLLYGHFVKALQNSRLYTQLRFMYSNVCIQRLHVFKGTDPFWGHDFLPILVIITIFFFFLVKKYPQVSEKRVPKY